MLQAVGRLRENLGRVHPVLEPLEEEREKQGQLANQGRTDWKNGCPLLTFGRNS
jgi:hypothetical protein